MDCKELPDYTITINCEGVDELTEKVSRLIELLKEANSLIDSLNGTTLKR